MVARFIFMNQRAERGVDVVRERNTDVLTLLDSELIKEYRMSKEEILNICELVKDDMTPLRRGGRASGPNLTFEEKVLISMKLLVSGSFQSIAKNYVNVS